MLRHEALYDILSDDEGERSNGGIRWHEVVKSTRRFHPTLRLASHGTSRLTLLVSCPARRRILHHIKVNHDSQRPEALAKNFVLLSEVNANIESVQRLYLDIERDYISFMESNVSKSGGKQNS